MARTSKEINRNFKIKVYGQGLNTLVGVAGLLAIVGDDALAERLVERAFACREDKQVCKLRRGIKITFYYA